MNQLKELTLTLLRMLLFYLSLETLVVALNAFRSDMKSLGLENWTKTKIQDFGGLLGEMVVGIWLWA